MTDGGGKAGSILEDRAADASISGPELIGSGFRPLERYAIELSQDDGSKAHMWRDTLRVGCIAGVLAIDPERDEIVLIHQFRLPAHLRIGQGDVVEIVAGFVDTGETPAAAARRECMEEIGVEPRSLHEILTFMPSPGMLDEYATIFVAAVDATRVPERCGVAGETEQTQPIRVRIDDALAALRRGRIHNGYLILALQWIALNRDRLPDLLRET